MYILITGGLGFIGSHLALNLLKNNKKIIIIDNLINSNMSTLYTLRKHAPHKNLIFFKANITEFFLINEVLKKYSVDTIFHFAGLKSVAESMRFPGKYFYNNVFGTKVLLRAAKKNKIKNLIFSSSATVYGKPKNLPLKESHPRKFLNFYAQNKIDIENIFFNDSFFLNECSTKILRYFNPIGAYHEGIIGEYPKGIPNNLMPYILNVARRIYPHVNIYGNDYRTPDGTGIRDYIHIMDLIEGHILAMNYQKIGNFVFNLGTGQGYSVLELINCFQKENNIKIPYNFSKRRVGDVDEVWADIALAKKELSFMPKYNLNKMCKDSWTFYKNIKI